MSGIPSAPPFTTRVPVQFICGDNPSLSITGSTAVFNNPQVFRAQTGSVAKIAQMINGTSRLSGAGEFAPFALDIEWQIMGYNDYLNLAALQPYNVTFITWRNIGYYGRLVVGGPSNDKPYTADVVSAKATFFVLGPSDDGGAATVNRIATPAAPTITSITSGGYIPSGTITHYWLTLHSKFGETAPVYFTATATANNSYNHIAWTWPTTTAYCDYASLYINSTNTPSTATLMAEVLSGSTPLWNDLVGVAGCSLPGAALYQTPPTVSTAYRGSWNNGIWINEP